MIRTETSVPYKNFIEVLMHFYVSHLADNCSDHTPGMLFRKNIPRKLKNILDLIKHSFNSIKSVSLKSPYACV
ncbi:hypothetical protein GYH30_040575 [Glycine max]|uniref:Uncharacterized protein n=1 Tax=Glycine max TaxID=3847 RepID=A0A0R0GSS7_SOYBN|nr:hypothetical protein GYH30_040575 [Glycine max]